MLYPGTSSGWSHVAGLQAGLRLPVQALTCPGDAAHPAPPFFSGAHVLSREALPLWSAGLAFHPGLLQVHCQVGKSPLLSPLGFGGAGAAVATANQRLRKASAHATFSTSCSGMLLRAALGQAVLGLHTSHWLAMFLSPCLPELSMPGIGSTGAWTLTC